MMTSLPIRAGAGSTPKAFVGGVAAVVTVMLRREEMTQDATPMTPKVLVMALTTVEVSSVAMLEMALRARATAVSHRPPMKLRAAFDDGPTVRALKTVL